METPGLNPELEASGLEVDRPERSDLPISCTAYRGVHGGTETNGATENLFPAVSYIGYTRVIPILTCSRPFRICGRLHPTLALG